MDEVTVHPYLKGKIDEIASDARRLFNKSSFKDRKRMIAPLVRRAFVLGFFIANELRDQGIRVELSVDSHRDEQPQDS